MFQPAKLDEIFLKVGTPNQLNFQLAFSELKFI